MIDELREIIEYRLEERRTHYAKALNDPIQWAQAKGCLESELDWLNALHNKLYPKPEPKNDERAK